MTSGPRNSVIHHLRRAALLRDGAGLSDGELLQAFIARRDEACFEALVRRHGPMVLGVCRRMLHSPHDSEDAFQATFLVLVQRAASVVPRESVGNWLYGVAYRSALEVRRKVTRQRVRERQVHEMPKPLSKKEETWQELLPLLDRELNRLPAKYRTPIVLCHLEGRTRKEAAGQLGLPVGTLSGRLTTAMRILAKRLQAHGLLLSGATLAAILSPSTASASVPCSLIMSTVRTGTLAAAGHAAATAMISTNVAALAKGVAQSMLLAKLKIVAVALLVVTALGSGTGAFTYRTLAAGQAEAVQPEGPNGSAPEAGKQSDREEQEQPPQADKVTDKRPDTEKSDKEQLQGTWIPLASIVAGIKKDPNDPKVVQWKLIFDGDRVTLPGDESVPYTLDPQKQPKEMDIQVEGDKLPMKAIYEFDGPTLKWSWRKQGGRPSDFDTDKNESILIIFKRRMMP